VIRVRLIKKNVKSIEYDLYDMKSLEETILNQIVIKGVKGIKKVLMRKSPKVVRTA